MRIRTAIARNICDLARSSALESLSHPRREVYLLARPLLSSFFFFLFRVILFPTVPFIDTFTIVFYSTVIDNVRTNNLFCFFFLVSSCNFISNNVSLDTFTVIFCSLNSFNLFSSANARTSVENCSNLNLGNDDLHSSSTWRSIKIHDISRFQIAENNAKPSSRVRKESIQPRKRYSSKQWLDAGRGREGRWVRGHRTVAFHRRSAVNSPW